MKVKQLIEELKQQPQEAEVGYFWDSAMRSDVDHVYLAKSGFVVLITNWELDSRSDEDEPVNNLKVIP